MKLSQETKKIGSSMRAKLTTPVARRAKRPSDRNPLPLARGGLPLNPLPLAGEGRVRVWEPRRSGNGVVIALSPHPDPPERLSKGPQAGEGDEHGEFAAPH